ncbi:MULTISPECIES: AAA family ATPase [unclassified Mesobacillus]|uniref:AAA family ATPase n=1 Tax=unclassified Mesobacillus TaxID=2675270 RepID=UPI00203F496E|nr:MULTISPECIES: AAA family ATPase [unclassified Mesobacillus]MCM3125839.1 hypothetical protein [Mesobacillus sp. MER 33]MCM3235860.1 hypothetical protein [Mesobacillus sp. MER 48]
MDINLKNCNSIETGEISIIENKVNIKYAINGTGKTTISKAIDLYINDRKSSTNHLMNLKPFKYRGDKENNNPEINGLDSINTVAVFNEDYVDKYVFLADDLLKDSFDIFIRDDKYEQGMVQINQLIKVIGDTFKDNEEIDTLLYDLSELISCFGNSKGLAKSSSLYKGIGTGNKIKNIPEELTVYKDFIQHQENVKWLKWQMNGSDYLEISNACPYCTSEIEKKKDTILAVKKEYNSKLIEHLNKVIDVVHRLSAYFTEDTYEKIIKITQSVDGLKDEHEKYLLEVREQIIVLYSKLNSIKSLGFQTLKEFDKVTEVINKYKIDLEFISHLNSTLTSEKISAINGSLDEILLKAGILQGEINKQRKHIEKTIKEYKNEINNFLKYAGYKYQVNLEEDEHHTYKLKLKHNDFVEDNVENAKLFLSYGEKNAFALVLFMYEVIKSNPDLIILDDPISSFDKNKKYAIIDMLFRGDNSLKGKTVLMLTHDFDPIVDMIYHFPRNFETVLPEGCFLENANGILTEKTIMKSDIKTFLEIARENIASLDEDINKLIYLRRFLEINDDKSEAYQLLSNLFKKRKDPLFITDGVPRVMTEEEITVGTSYIAEFVNGFNYQTYYDLVVDIENMIRLYIKTSNNYEKLQIYRIINMENSQNDVIKKFVNETFHIENDYLYQLNPCKYQIVPQYIIDECSKDIKELTGELV